MRHVCTEREREIEIERRKEYLFELKTFVSECIYILKTVTYSDKQK